MSQLRVSSYSSNAVPPSRSMNYSPPKHPHFQSNANSRATSVHGDQPFHGGHYRYTNNAMTSMQPRYAMEHPTKQFSRPSMSHFHQVCHRPLRDFSNHIESSYYDNRDGYHAPNYSEYTRRYDPVAQSHVYHRPKPFGGYPQSRFAHLPVPASVSYRESKQCIPDHGLRLLSACTDFPEVVQSAHVSSMNGGQEHVIGLRTTHLSECTGTSSEKDAAAKTTSSATVAKKTKETVWTNNGDDVEGAGQLLHLMARSANGAVQSSVTPKRMVEHHATSGFSHAKVQANHHTHSGQTIVVSEVADYQFAKRARFDDTPMMNGTSRMSFAEDFTNKFDQYVQTPITQKPCKCNRSQCLKLYCECFYRGKLCNFELCRCLKCLNTEEHNFPGGLRDRAVRGILARRTDAFEKQSRKKTGEGCSCVKSRCLKKYCDCYTNKILCSSKCKCISCLNTAAECDIPKQDEAIVGERLNMLLQVENMIKVEGATHKTNQDEKLVGERLNRALDLEESKMVDDGEKE